MSTVQQRFEHYLRKAQGGVDILRQAERPSALPYYLVIGATTACPLHCIMCSRDAVINQTNRMRLATFQRLLDEIRPIRVHIGDLGESLIDPDLAGKICEAKSRSINISLVSSYTVSRFTPETLINTGLDTFIISLDGATATTHNAIRGQSYFETTTSHIRAFVATRHQMKQTTPRLTLQFIIQKANYREIAAFIDLAANIGVEAVDYYPVQLTVALDRHDLLVGDMSVEETAGQLHQAAQKARWAGIQTNGALWTEARLQPYWQIYDGGQATPTQLQHCAYPWYSTYIAADGGVYGCCYHRYHDAAVLGNIYEADFATIWQGAAYRHFRAEMASGRSPFPACYACTPYPLADKLPGNWLKKAAEAIG